MNLAAFRCSLIICMQLGCILGIYPCKFAWWIQMNTDGVLVQWCLSWCFECPIKCRLYCCRALFFVRRVLIPTESRNKCIICSVPKYHLMQSISVLQVLCCLLPVLKAGHCVSRQYISCFDVQELGPTQWSMGRKFLCRVKENNRIHILPRGNEENHSASNVHKTSNNHIVSVFQIKQQPNTKKNHHLAWIFSSRKTLRHAKLMTLEKERFLHLWPLFPSFLCWCHQGFFIQNQLRTHHGFPHFVAVLCAT